jgi:hypothetical protein
MEDEFKRIDLNTTSEFLDSEIKDDLALASVNYNPAFNYLKFVLTDNIKNANKQRIPISEFDNLVKSGAYAPIKMGMGRIEPGHEDASPIGVISHLKKEDNKIIGLAAIWSKERPAEAKIIKENHAKGIPTNLSWEIYYTNSTKDEEGVEDLEGCSLRAVTLVGRPAYEGRTQILSVASEITSSEISDTVTTEMEEDVELKELEDKVTALTTELETAKAALEAKQAELDAKASELTAKAEELTAKETELASIVAEREELKQYKATTEKEQEDNKKLNEIKGKFSESGIIKEESFYKDNKDMLLGLAPSAMEFFMQELVSFKNTSASVHETVSVPDLTNLDDKKLTDPKELAKALRSMKK